MHLRMTKSLSMNKAWLIRLLVLWMAIVVVMTSLIYTTIHAVYEDNRKETLETMCDQRSRILQDQFSATVNHIHSLSVLISTFHYAQEVSAIDQKTFADYTARTSFDRPLLSGVAYAQRVLNSEREEFESEHGWTIRSMKTRKVSPVSDEYAPVIFSQETVSYIESLDMMSGEEDRENILRARATGNAVLTKPFRLLGSHRLGVVVTFPVYKYKLPDNPTSKQRIPATAGYIGGAFDVESLVENLLGKLSEVEAIVVNVCDVTNISKPLLVYGNFCKEGNVSVKRVSSLDFRDPFRRHQMICWYREKAPISWTAASTAFLFCVIGILIGYVVYNALIHITRVEDDFHQMQQLKIQAEAADVAKSQFLATVSHEIRTPLNGILGMLTLILDTNLNFTQKNFAQTAQACGKSLITLINEVLDSAKIEAGKLNLESVPFNVRSIIDEVLSLFSEKSRHKGIELAGLVSIDVPCTVIGDPGRFRQVITTLVDNSVKFTERGHVFVHVQLAKHDNDSPGNKPKTTSYGRKFKTLSGFETADDQNSWEDFIYHLTSTKEAKSKLDQKGKSVKLVVCVEDTGIGIPSHVQEHIYMPFMQADSSTSRNYGGTGLGLSICKRLVELMQGQIKFISRSSTGTTFSFTASFKLFDGDKIHQDLPTGFEDLEAILVDDKPLRATVTKYHLSRLGISVEVASSFANFKLQSERRVDMVLVEKDTWMTSTDWNKLKSGTMILLANTLSEGEIEKSKEAGFEEVFIMKPLRAIMIAASLQQVLGIKNKRKTDPVEQSHGVLDGLLRGKKILVVDDNKVNRIVAAGVLRKFGANVVCVESGKAAVALFHSSPHDFDACFMDIQMPEMDGFEATTLIRKVESKLPILAMTADVMYATRDKCVECGMDGYVSKPFAQEDLYQELAQFFDLSAN